MTRSDLYQLALGISLTLNISLYRRFRRLPKPPKIFTGNSKCRKCGYDTRSTIEGKCPECGEPVDNVRRPPGSIVICSFCGRSNRQAGPMLEGPGDVYICTRCVDVCHDIVLKMRAKPSAADPPEPPVV